ncbi:MAG: addiction module protein [Sulfuricella sp.]
MNQRALARAIAPVLKGGKHDGISCFVHISGVIILFATFVSTEDIMAAILEELENQALQLPLPERSKLIHRLIISLEDEPKESPEIIAKAWDEEIARRVADMEAGRTKWIPAEEVFKEIDTLIAVRSR